MCNNPLTKEPKLSAAVRIVPEWVDYDTKIKELLTGSSEASNDSEPRDKQEKQEQIEKIEL